MSKQNKNVSYLYNLVNFSKKKHGTLFEESGTVICVILRAEFSLFADIIGTCSYMYSKVPATFIDKFGNLMMCTTT